MRRFESCTIVWTFIPTISKLDPKVLKDSILMIERADLQNLYIDEAYFDHEDEIKKIIIEN
jgi:hypothetical protein